MKILQVNKFFYRHGGADHHFLDLSSLLARHGVEVGYFSMRDKRNLPTAFDKYFVKNIDFSRFNLSAVLNISKFFYSFEARRKIKELLDKFSPDAAHLHLIYHHLSPSILPALKERNIPIVMTVHDWNLICPNYWLFTQGKICERCRNKKFYQSVKYRCVKNSWWKSLLAAKAAYLHESWQIYQKNIDLLIAPGEFVKNEMVKFGWPRKKIKVLHHFLPTDIQKVSAPAPLPREVRFAYVGRLTEEKGIGRLVDFWLARDIPYHLEIFGDGEMYKEIFGKIKNSGNQQITMHGHVAREKVIERLKDFTAVIIPSIWYEVFGLTSIEAWSQGVPVIASNLGTLKELCERSKAGILFDWSDENSLKKALHNIQDTRYRRRAVEYMRENHLPEEYLGSLFEIYRELRKNRV